MSISENIRIFAPKIYDIDCIEHDMGCAIQPTKSQKELLETYKKTMRLIQHVIDHFDFLNPEAERKSMFTDGLNEEDFVL